MKPAKQVRPWTVIGLMLTAVVLARCGTAPSSAPQLAPTQPNRTSPLAASMRYLDAELVGFRTRFLEGDGDWTFLLEDDRHGVHAELLLEVVAGGVVVLEHVLFNLWEDISQGFASNLSAVNDPGDESAEGALVKLGAFFEEWEELVVPVVLVNEVAVGLPVGPGVHHSLLEVIVCSAEVSGVNLGLCVIEVDFPLWGGEGLSVASTASTAPGGSSEVIVVVVTKHI